MTKAKTKQPTVQQAVEIIRRSVSEKFKRDQIIQPYEYGDDASKSTCLWLKGLPKLRPTGYVPPRMVCGCGHVSACFAGEKYVCQNCNGEHKALPRWANQTDSGNNKLGPSEDRWKERARTYQGWADAFAMQWGGPLAQNDNLPAAEVAA